MADEIQLQEMDAISEQQLREPVSDSPPPPPSPSRPAEEPLTAAASSAYD